jgi:chlorophyllide a reductase subunit Y
MLRYARAEAESGPVAAPLQGRNPRPTVTLLGEVFPADPVGIGRLLEPMGLAVGPSVPTREWRELYSALDAAAVAAVHPFYTASTREFEAAGRQVIGSAPVGYEGTANWLESMGKACSVPGAMIAAAKDAALPAIKEALNNHRINARITLSGYEGSELLVGRLLVEAGAQLHYVGTACPKTAHNRHDAEWLQAKGVLVQFRASLEQDLEAMHHFKPDLAIGTTPVVQKAKEIALPALYFTNLISARPLMGLAGTSSLATTVATAVKGQARFKRMLGFFSPNQATEVSSCS